MRPGTRARAPGTVPPGLDVRVVCWERRAPERKPAVSILAPLLSLAGIIASVILIVLIFRGSRIPVEDVVRRKRVNRWFWILGIFVAAVFFYLSFT